MEPPAACVLAAVLLIAGDSRATLVGSPSSHVELGHECLRLAPEEVAVRDPETGWSVVATTGTDDDSEAACPAYPVLYVAGTPPSASTRRIVTGQLSVRLRPDRIDPQVAAARLACDFDLVDDGLAEGAAPWRLFHADPPARALEVVAALRADERVAEVEVVVARQMTRRGWPDDPLLPLQWHLHHTVATADGGAPADLGVERAWGDFDSASDGWRGRGVRIGIIDDGIDYGQVEFAGGRLDVGAGRNWNGAGTSAAAQGTADVHGTAVAGLAAAAADNAAGGTGVAPAAGLISLRLTAAAHDDSQEAQAMAHLATPRTGSNAAALIHIKNASWGPSDGMFRLAGPGALTRQALINATRDGRGGRGTVFVWAGGNGGAFGEDANADGYANNPYVIAVGAMDSNGRVPSYSEGGACLAVVAPSGSETGLPIVTADRTGLAGFNPPGSGTDLPDLASTAAFTGTSAAAPLVAGVCALMLETNPALGWREVKEILLRSARRVNPRSPEWLTNSVGLRFHPMQGAGLVDAAAATAMAAAWTPLGLPTEMRASATQAGPIPDDSEAGLTRTFSIGPERRVEQALLRFSASHPYRGDLKITLTSPGGTTSVLAPSYFAASPTGQKDYDDWVFCSLHFWGENSRGTWTLKVADVLAEETGSFIDAELTLLAAELLPLPSFTSAATRTAVLGQSFVHSLAATHGPCAYTVAGTLPPGLVFEVATGTLRGRPSEAGTYTLEFCAASATGMVSQSFELKVAGMYEVWAAAQELPSDGASPEDDPDHDQRANLLEYASGGNPMAPDSPEIARCLAGSEMTPSATFVRLPSRKDVVWQVEHSSDCITWTTVAESRYGQPAASLDDDHFSVTETPWLDASMAVTIAETTDPTPAQGWFRLRVAIDE